MRYLVFLLVIFFFPQIACAAQYAIVNDTTHTVVDVIQWDEITPYTPPVGTILVKTGLVGEGWTYVNGVFVVPEPPASGG